MSQAPLRVGLVGYGLAGRVFHGPLMRATRGLRVESIVTADPERRARAQRDHPDAAVFDSAEQLWAHASDHDIAVIASANVAHARLAHAAVDAGLAVVVDKPLAATAIEARALVEHAARAGRILTVFQNRRWDGDFLTVQSLIREGLVGRVSRFESRFERWRPEIHPGAWRERSAPEEAGGLLFDLGSHLIDQAVVLFGRPLAVHAELHRRRVGAEVDDDSFVALTHPGGVRAHLWMSAVAAIQGPRFRVLGSAGAYEKYGLDPQEAALVAGEQPGEPAWGTEAPEDWGTLRVGNDTRALETAPGDYPAFYEHLEEAVRSNGPPPVDPMDAVGVLDIIEAARRSAVTGTTIALSDQKA